MDNADIISVNRVSLLGIVQSPAFCGHPICRYFDLLFRIRIIRTATNSQKLIFRVNRNPMTNTNNKNKIDNRDSSFI